MFVANGDAVAVNATGVEITPGAQLAFTATNEVIQMNNQHPDSTEENSPSKLGRREFLTASAGAVAAALLAAGSNSLLAESSDDGMIYRTLGRTGERVSIIGLGGWHIGQPSISEHESIQLIRQAIDRGITFMDNCWDYNEGASEVRMGKALKDGYRQKVFLMDKIDGRTKPEAARQIDTCLQRLQTDRIDMMQFHEVIRHSNTLKPIEALHYCLNLPIPWQITGIDSQRILDQALEAVRTFKPLTQAEVASLLKRTRSAALEGKYELYKTSTRFDGTQR